MKQNVGGVKALDCRICQLMDVFLFNITHGVEHIVKLARYFILRPKDGLSSTLGIREWYSDVNNPTTTQKLIIIRPGINQRSRG